jgi:hypothetical protein
MGSKVGVREWWGKEKTEYGLPESEEVAWERMLNLNTCQITDTTTKGFIEVAYLRSHRHYEQNQKEDGIWDTVMQGSSTEDMREELKRFKSNKAPGP